MKASTFLFATDLVDEGTEVVLDRLQRSRLDGLTMACNYHHSRDVFPHNPVHRVRYMQGGVFFRPERSKYAKLRIQPDAPSWVLNDDPLDNVCRAASRRGRGSPYQPPANATARHLRCYIARGLLTQDASRSVCREKRFTL